MSGFVAEGAEILRHVKERRIRRTVGQRGQRGVDDLDAQLDRFETTERAEACGAVGVQFNRNAIGVGEHDRHQAFAVVQASAVRRDL